jgi:hypothetical protein
MPRKPQKKPHEMTSQELAKKLFPKELKQELDKIANPKSSPSKDK